MTSVRPIRAALVVGGALALTLAIAVFALGVPEPVLRLLGAPREPLARYGGARMRFRPSVDARALDHVAWRSTVTRDNDDLIVEFPAMPREAMGEVTAVLNGGALAMHEAKETNFAARVGPSPREGVELDIDQWFDETTLGRHQVAYLHGPTREALERAIAARGIAPDPGTHVAFERIDPIERGARWWRTYLVADEVALDGAAVEHARVAFDPMVERPLVELELTPAGRARFCEVTRRLAGHKLVTMNGDRVISAPIINGPICGGHLQVSIGGTDRMRQQDEATALAQAFDRGAIPPGQVLTHEWFEAPDLRSLAWLALGLLALGGGMAGALLTYLVVRALRPRWRLRAGFDGGRFPWRRLLVSLAAPVVLIAGRYVTLPGVNDVELAHVAARAHVATDVSLAGVLALGVTPILAAYGLVELVALIVRPLRWRRHDPRGRAALERGVVVLAIAIALVQGWFFASHLESLARGGAEVVMNPGLGFHAMTALTLATGALLLSAVAGFVRDRGLGNGYGTLMLVGTAFVVFDTLLSPARGALVDANTLAWLACATAIVGGTIVVLRWRIVDAEGTHAYRLPTCGLAPLGDGPALVTMIGALVMLIGGWGAGPIVAWMQAASTNPAIVGPVVLGSIVLWSWVFARPNLVAPRPTTAVWARATALSGIALVAFGAAGMLAARVHPSLAHAATPLVLVICAAAALDVIDDARAHRIDLAPVAVLHQIQRASAIEQALAAAAIPSHVHAGNLRAIVAFFGPWAPAVVLVPAARADEARAIVDSLYPPRTP